jgi:hypothetical protein
MAHLAHALAQGCANTSVSECRSRAKPRFASRHAIAPGMGRIAHFCTHKKEKTRHPRVFSDCDYLIERVVTIP